MSDATAKLISTPTAGGNTVGTAASVSHSGASPRQRCASSSEIQIKREAFDDGPAETVRGGDRRELQQPRAQAADDSSRAATTT